MEGIVGVGDDGARRKMLETAAAVVDVGERFWAAWGIFREDFLGERERGSQVTYRSKEGKF